MNNLETDYLVIGTGAAAMAFVDSFITEQPRARILMVDKYHRPGGHWNDAYPFVRLHTPAAWYGVASKEMSDCTREASGANEGMWRLANGPEIMAYFDSLMQQRFLPSGQVRWLPRCEWLGGDNGVHRIKSLTSGEERDVCVHAKRVDATLSRTEIPSTQKVPFAIAPGVDCIAPNLLPSLSRPFGVYTVIGAGKTGMDTCLWLLENGVPRERIRWIMPRDPWMQDRANFQPGPCGWRHYLNTMASTLDAIAQAEAVNDVFEAMESAGVWKRLDPLIVPSTFRCAIVSSGELNQLKGLQEAGCIARIGRVEAIEPQVLHCTRGSIPADPDTIYINCTAAGLQPLAGLPVFDSNTIHIQTVRACQLVFSAALIAWVETHVAADLQRNKLCRPVPTPEEPLDLLRMWSVTLSNLSQWRQNPDLMSWIGRCRLNGQTAILKGVEIDDEVRTRLNVIDQKAAPAAARASRLLKGRAGAELDR